MTSFLGIKWRIEASCFVDNISPQDFARFCIEKKSNDFINCQLLRPNMIKLIIFLQIVLFLVACTIVDKYACTAVHKPIHTDDHCYSETCSQTSGKDSEYGKKGSKWRDAMDSLNDLDSKLADFPETRKKLGELKRSLEKQNNKNSCKSTLAKIPLEEVKKLFTITINSVEKLKSRDPMEVLQGVLDIVAGFSNVFHAGNSFSLIFQTLSIAVGVLFTESKPNQRSVVQQITSVVHDEMINLNKRLHDQKFHGLKRRLSEQISQLHHMKEGKKLDDPSLWNDYAQFLSELAFRFESPLPFRYENNLTEDPDVRDFVAAVVQYSEAHSFFVALLLIAKAKYTEFGTTREDDMAAVERKMIFQHKEAQQKLSFLSEERFLTFLGRVDGGKLTKILALSRRLRDRSLVEIVRHSLDLSPMLDLSTIESSAKKVNQQEVTLRSVEKCNWSIFQKGRIKVQFINDADFPVKIMSGEVGLSQENRLKFQKKLPPRDLYTTEPNFGVFGFSTAGYIVLYLNGNMLSSKNNRVIEFAVSSGYLGILGTIGMQDKTGAEFLRGLDAYNAMSQDPVTLYFSENGKYYIAKAEHYICLPDRFFRFIIQDFDPEDPSHLSDLN